MGAAAVNLQRFQLYLHDVALLESADPGCRNAPLQGCHTLELHGAAAVMQSHVQLGHRVNAQRDAQRLANGLRFIQLWRGDALLGSSWIVNGGGRYVDEVMWLLPIAANEYWVRDVFISPACRGQKLFPAFLRLIAQNHVPDCQRMWSDVDWPHTASMRVHLARAGAGPGCRRALALAQPPGAVGLAGHANRTREPRDLAARRADAAAP
jgi:hypothetical protein